MSGSGAVTFIQRFAAELRSACASHASRARGSALNLNVHFHTLALDGVYRYAPDQGRRPRFLPLPPPEPDEIGRVLAGAARRIRRLIEARHAGDEDALARDEPLMALLAAASLRTRVATGPHRGEPWWRLGDREEPHEGVDGVADTEASDRVAQVGGMSLHADVAVPAHDRRRLERLCRYVSRPPLASERLEERPDGTLTLRLKTRWRDGTTHVLMERSELIERLVPLIPPPRAHQVRYHDVLAPSASMRDRIVPQPMAHLPESESAESVAGSRPLATGGAQGKPALPSPSGKRRRPSECSAEESDTPGAAGRTRHEVDGAPRGDPGAREHAGRMRWAALLRRVFEVDALRCPRCGSTMRLIAAIEDPDVARRILECLELPSRSPPMGEVTAPLNEPVSQEDDWLFNQSGGCDWP